MPNDKEKGLVLTMSEFTPAKEQLQQIVARTSTVDVKDLTAVHGARIELRDLRVGITKKGKELRDGAIKFQKDVLGKERELVGIIEPEEERLGQAEDELKLRKEMETRREELPTRRAALESVGDGVEATDDELLAMTDDEFNAYRVRRIDAKLVKDKEAFEQKKRDDEAAAKKKAEDEEAERRAKLAAEEAEAKKLRDAESAKLAAERAELDKEKARIAAEEKAKKEAEEAAERELQRKEREAKLAREAEEAAAAKKAAEEADARKEANFQAWLRSMGFDETQGDQLITTGGSVTAYRPMGVYDPKVDYTPNGKKQDA